MDDETTTNAEVASQLVMAAMQPMVMAFEAAGLEVDVCVLLRRTEDPEDVMVLTLTAEDDARGAVTRAMLEHGYQRVLRQLAERH